MRTAYSNTPPAKSLRQPRSNRSECYTRQVKKLVIFSDGASKGNPGPGGWGAIVASDEMVEELGGKEAHTTNNRMELKAALEALACAETYRPDAIDLYTDSAYVIGGASSWIKGWQRNGWITSTKQPVLNRDLWEVLAVTLDRLHGKIHWHNVGGHIGIPGNERVDMIASDSAVGKPVTLFRGKPAQYEIDISHVEFDASLKQKKSASRERSKAKAYSYVSEVDGKVEVHKTWAECEARVRGKKARFKKTLSAADEAALIAQFSRA